MVSLNQFFNRKNYKMMENLLNICRACLTEQGEFQSVFVSDESSGLNIHLAEMLMACASIQVTFGDGLPEQICKNCAAKTVDMFLFKVKCEESDSRLRNKLGKSPLKDSIHFENDLADISDKITAESLAKIELSDDDEDSEDVKFAMDDDKYLIFNNYYNDNTCKKDGENIETNLLKCKLCPKVYNRTSYLAKHEQFHLNEQMYQCEICEKKFTRSDLLERHKLAHAKKQNEKLVEIEKDDKNECTKDENNVNLKLKIKSRSKNFTCKICKKKCSKKFRKMHLKTHYPDKPYRCELCDKGFNQISNLNDHMRTHSGEKPFLCSTCGKGFNQLGNLRQHTVRHSGVKEHVCNICSHAFASKGELSAHIRKHTGARPFVCSICHRGFTTSSSLSKHKRIHSGEKPYECDVCHMRFSRNGILSRHKRIHTGEKPYVCKFCSKAFTQSNDLNAHFRIHTGEKPFICDQCGQAFRQSSALKTHKRTHNELKDLESIEQKPKIKHYDNGQTTSNVLDNTTWVLLNKIEETISVPIK